MMVDSQARYVRSHEWARKDGALVAVGLSAYAVLQLGKIVYIELLEVGKVLRQGEVFGSIESVKAVVELSAPVGGRVVEVNAAVPDDPDALAKDAYQKGWMIKLEPADMVEYDGLLDADAYREFLQTQA